MTTQAGVRTSTGSTGAANQRPPAPLSRLALCGLALAVLAETGSLGLLGLSGWFIAACAIAGATTFSTFSYIAPSGGVRSFALLRIGASYGQRLAQHAAVLRSLALLRVQLFSAATLVVSRRSRPLRDGSVLDRAINDTETESMSLITVTSPLTVFVTTTVVGVVVVAVVSRPAAVVLAGAAALSLLISWRARRHEERVVADDVVRAAARAELVTNMDAWPELVSLGAVDRLVDRSSRAIEGLADGQARSHHRETSARASIAVLEVVALVLAAGASVVIDRVDASGVALVLLLGTGLLGVASRAGQAFDALVSVRAARNRRLALLASENLSDDDLPSISAVFDEGGLRFEEYRLPDGLFRSGDRTLHGHVDRGSALVVTGPSGSGKTTFLDALAEALSRDAVQVPVDDHIFTGTVASNLRLGLPGASDDQLVAILRQMRLTAAAVEPSTPVGVGGRALSGGEQTRLRLARAVLADPRVLIADEPLAGLDAETASAVLRCLRTSLPNAVLVLSLHYLDENVRGALGEVQRIQLD